MRKKKVAPSLTVGADPELFLFDPKTNKYVSAIGKFGGTKSRPKKLGCGWVQEDNVAVEYNIPPATTRDEFISYNMEMISRLRTRASEMGLELLNVPIAKFEDSQLNHPNAMAMGCDPDYNAYTNVMNNAPDAMQMEGLRTGAGHVHIGMETLKISPNYSRELVLHCDAVVLAPFLLEGHGTPEMYLRRKYYGASGAFRPKTYGVEYRALDNFWLASEELMGLVFDRVKYAAETFVMYGPMISAGTRATLRNLIDHNSPTAHMKYQIGQQLANFKVPKFVAPTRF